MNIEKFEKDMQVFSFSQHQDFLTYHKLLLSHEWTIDDARKWVEFKKKQLNEVQAGMKFIKNPCPECKAFMQLLPVNTSPGTMTGDDSQSVWLCRNKGCMHTIYNKETIEQLMAR